MNLLAMRRPMIPHWQISCDHRFVSVFPFGLPSPPPLPNPLLPFAPERAIAVDFNDVDRSIVIAGGVTAANFPQVARNLRRSSSAIVPEIRSLSDILLVSTFISTDSLCSPALMPPQTNT